MSQLTVPIVSTDAATLSDCSALSWDRWFLSHRSECPNVPARRPRCCSAFGSFWIYLAASSRVTSWRPRGSGIGSSNLRVQPRSLMTPPLLVELGSKALRRSWRHVLVTWIAPRTRSRRQRHRCRRARLPKVYPGALRKPNPCPRSVSTSFTRHFCHESLLQPI